MAERKMDRISQHGESGNTTLALGQLPGEIICKIVKMLMTTGDILTIVNLSAANRYMYRIVHSLQLKSSRYVHFLLISPKEIPTFCRKLSSFTSWSAVFSAWLSLPELSDDELYAIIGSLKIFPSRLSLTGDWTDKTFELLMKAEIITNELSCLDLINTSRLVSLAVIASYPTLNTISIMNSCNGRLLASLQTLKYPECIRLYFIRADDWHWASIFKQIILYDCNITSLLHFKTACVLKVVFCENLHNFALPASTTNLTVLHSGLTDGDLRYFRQVETLNISSNMITSLDALHGETRNSSLRILDIRGNLVDVSKLHHEMFPNIKTIRY